MLYKFPVRGAHNLITSVTRAGKMATPSEPLLPSLGPEPFPEYDPDVFYDNTKKLAAFEWEEYYWPQRKARLAWRVEQWRNRVTQLMQADRKWFAHICTLHEELKELEAQNDLNRTPIVIRQFLVTKWALIDLEQVRNETAPLHLLGDSHSQYRNSAT